MKIIRNGEREMKKVTRYICDFCNKELPTERGMAGHEAIRCFFSPGSHSCATCHYHIGVKNGSRWYDTACEIFKMAHDNEWYSPEWESAEEIKNCPYYKEIDYELSDSKKVGRKRNYWLREVEKLPTSKAREK